MFNVYLIFTVKLVDDTEILVLLLLSVVTPVFQANLIKTVSYRGCQVLCNYRLGSQS